MCHKVEKQTFTSLSTIIFSGAWGKKPNLGDFNKKTRSDTELFNNNFSEQLPSLAKQILQFAEILVPFFKQTITV